MTTSHPSHPAGSARPFATGGVLPQATNDPAETVLKSPADFQRLQRALDWHQEGTVIDVTFSGKSVLTLFGLLRRDGNRVLLTGAIDMEGRRHWATEIELRDDCKKVARELCLAWPARAEAALAAFDVGIGDQLAVIERYETEVGLH